MEDAFQRQSALFVSPSPLISILPSFLAEDFGVDG